LIVAQYESTTSSFFFDVAPTTYICSLSLHDALPISFGSGAMAWGVYSNASGYGSVADGDSSTAVGGWLYYEDPVTGEVLLDATTDRKSTRLNSSHVKISYAVFCLKKKKKIKTQSK